ncbi:tryptophan-rich sensory protein [Roseiarcaceae bacterium H3SJ34-1]|uniref:TspO/MBR family protein n=1 Tax=Terripilifer ovatus TaxID=3032367 RepID=UPI003AB96756|nr:tryptophan-rich sensory protein [Roseiarcaceae bacterium H3SJ34-1]
MRAGAFLWLGRGNPMANQITARKSNGRYAALIAYLALSLAVSAIGGFVTAASVGTWYPTLQKPPFNPPNWIFGPVWTILYLLMAIAGWRVWLQRKGVFDRPNALYGFQLALNLLWSILFFGLHAIGWALAEVAVLLAVIIATTLIFWRIDRTAGVLFLPYVAWVAFACLLNASIWWLNS